MKEMRVGLGDRSYSIHVGHGCLEDVGQACKDLGLGQRLAIITNPTVADLYLEPVERSLGAAGFSVSVATMADGEEHKTLETAGRLHGDLIEGGLDRGSAVVTLGGGVVGDVGGFVAATYMRGIPFVQVPTTVEAQVDASVGGKTAVDHALGKNMIGAFHQPGLVWIDTETLKTLPDDEFLAGMAEVVKHALIRDSELVDFLDQHVDTLVDRTIGAERLDWLIARNCAIKASVVEADETERGLREILNYGHTIGHAIEAASGFKLKHGQAVAAGMVANGKIAVDKGVLDRTTCERQEALFRRLGIARWAGATSEKLFDLMRSDKKTRDGVIRFVLLHGIEKAVSHDDVTSEEIEAGMAYARSFVTG
ncbi:MAG: 3-dehydroquinate synthase [Gemmatimonadetes bacterium]|nr:3-dehydroquinate synthase [Gemmatimonadota bacterium]